MTDRSSTWRAYLTKIFRVSEDVAATDHRFRRQYPGNQPTSSRCDCLRRCSCRISSEMFTLHVVRFIALVLGLAYLVLLLFTRQIYGVAQSFAGMIFSMEAYNGAKRRDRQLVLYYSIFEVIQGIVSILVGSTLLSGQYFECFLIENQDTCEAVQFAWGTILVVMAIVEVSTAVIAFVAWSNMRTRRSIEREHLRRGP